jgi:hypothetical protein
MGLATNELANYLGWDICCRLVIYILVEEICACATSALGKGGRVRSEA